MSSWQTAITSLVGLLIGAALAVAGSHYKDPALTNLGFTIAGGAMGMFVPNRQISPDHSKLPTSRRQTLPPSSLPPPTR